MNELVSVEEATTLILNTISKKGDDFEIISSIDSSGRVLMEAIFADRDFPPFDRATMDGIAIQYYAIQNPNNIIKIEGIAAAGDPQKKLMDPQNAIEIMTGAVLPIGTDTVIRYEDVIMENQTVRIPEISFKKGSNIHIQGSDRKKGDLLLEAGRRISPAEIAILATVGKSKIKVSPKISIAIVATGDELVDISTIPLPHQIRMSNVYSIASILSGWDAYVETFHLADDDSLIHKTLDEIFQKFELVVLSGGVSKGKKDYIPTVMNELGVKKIFHGVRQRPGKPFWFGKKTSSENVVFALPGNPVSSFMCTHRYILPWIRKKLGLNPFSPNFAVLAGDFSFAPPLEYFLQVRLKWDHSGILLAYPIEGKGSGDLANVTEADGFLQLPEQRSFFKKGESYPLFVFRPLFS